MTPREFRYLYTIPIDIKVRTRRIEQLEAMQADGPQDVADIVKSSHGEGNNCYLGHVTVHGTDAAFTRRESEIEQLKGRNQKQEAMYWEGQKLLETCDDALLRAMLSSVCVEGKKPQDVAIELTEEGYDIEAEAIRKRVDRWIKQNAR